MPLLDYCNALYLGISESLVTRLQRVQNAAVRFLTNTRKWDHRTPVLISLHWLPVKYRIQYKVLMFVFEGHEGHDNPLSVSTSPTLLSEHASNHPTVSLEA